MPTGLPARHRSTIMNDALAELQLRPRCRGRVWPGGSRAPGHADG